MKTRRIVLDTGPLFLYFAEDRRAKELIDAIQRGKTSGRTCETNLAEFYYKTCEKLGREVAELRNASIRGSMLMIESPNERLTRMAAALKCEYRGRLSLADAYVLALCQMYGGDLVTTDRRLKELNLVPTSLLEVPRSAH